MFPESVTYIEALFGVTSGIKRLVFQLEHHSLTGLLISKMQSLSLSFRLLVVVVVALVAFSDALAVPNNLPNNMHHKELEAVTNKSISDFDFDVICERVSLLQEEIYPLFVFAASVGLADASVTEAAWTSNEDQGQTPSQEDEILIFRGMVTLLEKLVDELNPVYETKWQSEVPEAVEWDLPEVVEEVHLLRLRLNRLEEQASHLSDREDQARDTTQVLHTRGHSYNEKSPQHCTSMFCFMRSVYEAFLKADDTAFKNVEELRRWLIEELDRHAPHPAPQRGPMPLCRVS